MEDHCTPNSSNLDVSKQFSSGLYLILNPFAFIFLAPKKNRARAAVPKATAAPPLQAPGYFPVRYGVAMPH